MIADEPNLPLEGVRFVCPPKWLARLASRAGAKAIWMFFAGLRYRPDLYMGYHLAPGACTALIVGRLLGRPSCYQMTCGPVEFVGGGVEDVECVGRYLGRPSKLLEGMAWAVVNLMDLIVVRGRKAKEYLTARNVKGTVAIITGSIQHGRQPEKAERAIHLVFVGRLAPVKQVDQFIAIVEAVSRVVPSVRAAIIGDGPLMGDMKALVDRLGLTNNVAFLGKREDVQSVLACSQVFVLTSQYEGLSIALAEAMAAGVVPVVANVGELSDLVADGVNGYLVEPNVIAQYAEKVVQLLQDRAIRADFSIRAQESATQYCDIKMVSVKWGHQIQDAVFRASRHFLEADHGTADLVAPASARIAPAPVSDEEPSPLGSTTMKEKAEKSDNKASALPNADWTAVMIDRRASNSTGSGLLGPPELSGTCIVDPVLIHRIVGVSPTPPRSYPHQARKVLAFICIEGPGRTARKVRDMLSLKKSEAEEALLVVAGRLRGTSQWCTACGRQYSARQPELLFRQEMVFPAADEADAASLAQQLLHMLKRDTRLLRSLLEHSQYSQEPPPVLDVGRPHAEASWCAKACPPQPGTPSVPVGGQDGQAPSLIQVGGGNYPCVYTLPNMRGHIFDTLVEYNPLRAEQLGKRFGFRHIETDYRRVLDRAALLDRPTVVVASYHSTHTAIAIDFMQANSKTRVLIEKPPVIDYDQLERLLPYLRDKTRFIEIGYNRRYARMIRRAVDLLQGHQGPLFVTCIIREDDMTDAHWNYWQAEGTRIHANLCHWIDLGVLMTGQRPVEIVCMAGKDFQFSSEVSIRFEDDSVVNLISGVIGNGLRGVQEYIDIRAGYLTIKIDDFLKMTVLDGGRKMAYRSWPREKGHVQMYRSFSSACVEGGRPKYSLRDFVRSSVVIEEVCEMLKRKERHRMVDLGQLKAWEEPDGR